MIGVAISRWRASSDEPVTRVQLDKLGLSGSSNNLPEELALFLVRAATSTAANRLRKAA
jgi:hypothetical protein